MKPADQARDYVAGLTQMLKAVPSDAIAQIARVLERARSEGRTVVLFGNGGSAANASHIALDLSKTTSRTGAARLRALALTDNVPLITAWANDVAYERVFAEQLDNLVGPGDVAIALSCSGTSPNVVMAVRRARERGATTIALTGFEGGHLKALVDICLVVPGEHMGRIEDTHLVIGHILTDVLAGRRVPTSP